MKAFFLLLFAASAPASCDTCFLPDGTEVDCALDACYIKKPAGLVEMPCSGVCACRLVTGLVVPCEEDACYVLQAGSLVKNGGPPCPPP